MLHLDAFAAMTEEFGHLEVLGGLARALAARLRTLWQDVAELPLYPAFRGQPEESG
jgi:Mn-containing catalase